MSPAGAGRAVDARSDIFSFGIVPFGLAGRPFGGKTDLEISHAGHRHRSISTDIPDPLRTVVEKALEKSVREFRPHGIWRLICGG
jgi:hypothetical protein